MAYMQTGSVAVLPALSELRELLVSHGWTWITALCMLVFSLFHWPCSTTLLTVKKETGRLRWMLVAAVLPTLSGFIICFIISTAAKLLGLA